MIRVYTASKLGHGVLFRHLDSITPWVHFYARWLKHTLIQTPDAEGEAGEFWLQDQQDVKDADVVLVYVESGEHLRGALVEAGMALAYGIPVIVVGDHSDYGTWQYHPGVIRALDMDKALWLLKECAEKRSSLIIPRYRK